MATPKKIPVSTTENNHSALRQQGPHVCIAITVHTRAKRNALRPYREDSYKLDIMAVPQKGEANEAIFRFLASFFHKTLSEIEIIKGSSSKQKQILVHNCSLPEIIALLR